MGLGWGWGLRLSGEINTFSVALAIYRNRRKEMPPLPKSREVIQGGGATLCIWLKEH